MALEDLPNGFFVPTRDEVRDQYQKDVRLRVPGAPIGDGSQAFAEGSVIGDTLAPVYGDAVSIARDADLDTKTFEGLKAEARGMGIPELLPATGGAGFVKISASAGGVPIEKGREIYDEKTSLRFECLATAIYFDGQPVPVIGIDTGPTTNLPAGTVLSWRSPPPGLGRTATIIADANGDGFTGGRNEENADELRERIKAERANPAAAGNDAELQRRVKEAAKRLGIAVQEVFVYPCIHGPGTTGFTFTLRPARPGGTRAPTSIQLALVRAYLVGIFPYDDGLLECTILEVGVTCSLEVDWSPGANGWVDLNPWPRAADDWHVVAVSDPLQIIVAPTNGPTTTPQVGQTIAFYDRASATFKRKRLAAVDGPTGEQYVLVFDATNNASDPSYTPAVSERFCPWAETLDPLVEPMAREFGKLGPGEQVPAFFDAGYRQRRDPPNLPGRWPSVLRHKMLDAIDDRPEIGDVQWVAPTIPFATPVGAQGVSSNLLALERLLVFPP